MNGASGGNSYAYGITSDASDNLYITGYTSVALNGQSLHGTRDLFLSKLSSSGKLLWTSEDGASGGNVYGYGITLDSLNNIYITGSTSTGIDNQNSSGSVDAFFSQYSSAGVLE